MKEPELLGELLASLPASASSPPPPGPRLSTATTLSWGTTFWCMWGHSPRSDAAGGWE